MKKNRDIQGFINLECLNDGYLIYNNYIDDKKRVMNFIYDNENYYFKINTSPNSLYNELIVSELAKDYGISCADYDLASLDNTTGVLSKCVIAENDTYYTMEEILEKVYGYVPIKNNNLEDIWYALSTRYDEVTVFHLMNQIVSLFLFDILIGNRDRNVTNFGIIENNNGVSLAPLFDNETILSDTCIDYGGYSLAVSRDDFFYCAWDLEEEDNFLYKFLNISDSRYIKLFEEKLWIIEKENLLKVFSRIENKIKSNIPSEIKLKKIKSFEDNISMINGVLEKVKIKKR